MTKPTTKSRGRKPAPPAAVQPGPYVREEELSFELHQDGWAELHLCTPAKVGMRLMQLYREMTIPPADAPIH